MASFEVLYGHNCRSLVGWFELSEIKLIGSDLVTNAIEKVNIIHD